MQLFPPEHGIRHQALYPHACILTSQKGLGKPLPLAVYLTFQSHVQGLVYRKVVLKCLNGLSPIGSVHTSDEGSRLNISWLLIEVKVILLALLNSWLFCLEPRYTEPDYKMKSNKYFSFSLSLSPATQTHANALVSFVTCTFALTLGADA